MPQECPHRWPHARLMRQPGPVSPVRSTSRCQSRAGHFRLLLAPGKSLYNAVVDGLAEVQAVSASMTLLGGAFASFRYCVAPATPDGPTVAAYSEPLEAGPSWLICGNATLGFDYRGAPLVHCHAAFVDVSGQVRGGHVIPTEAVVGERPVAVLVTAFEGFALRQCFDEETNMPLFMPVSGGCG